MNCCRCELHYRKNTEAKFFYIENTAFSKRQDPICSKCKEEVFRINQPHTNRSFKIEPINPLLKPLGD